jgi:16S rRNA (cytosine967-C5)-methyltransferase
MERLPDSMDRGKRRRCQFLLYGVVRHLWLLESSVDAHLRKRPRPGLRSALLVAGFELLSEPDKKAQIVDHAVGEIGRRFSSGEKAMANAVLRKVGERLENLDRESTNSVAELAEKESHPEWLVRRWQESFGWEAARKFTNWNQTEPEIYFLPISAEAKEVGLESPWRPYRMVAKGDWPQIARLLDEGAVYVQDPGTRLGPEMLRKVFSEGRILDLCSAPGGKTILFDKLFDERLEEIVSVDLPGPRFDRLRANMHRMGISRARPLASDIFQIDFAESGRFEGVYLDAPCSNTGVLQKKPDVKWRLTNDAMTELIALQERMLAQASLFTSPSGWLVYSTCSVETDENESVVDRFLSSAAGGNFELVEQIKNYPWETGLDGAGVALMQRVAGS